MPDWLLKVLSVIYGAAGILIPVLPPNTIASHVCQVVLGLGVAHGVVSSGTGGQS